MKTNTIQIITIILILSLINLNLCSCSSRMTDTVHYTGQTEELIGSNKCVDVKYHSEGDFFTERGVLEKSKIAGNVRLYLWDNTYKQPTDKFTEIAKNDIVKITAIELKKGVRDGVFSGVGIGCSIGAAIALIAIIVGLVKLIKDPPPFGMN